MKSIILLASILIVNVSFSQERKNSLRNKIFNNIEVNHYSTNSTIINAPEEIKLLALFEPINNSEGKFPVYKIDNESKKIETELVSSKKDVNLSPNVLLSQNYSNFINDIIIKKMSKNENIDFNFENEALSYGDRGIELYKNLTDYVNLVETSFNVNSDIEVKFGGYTNLNNFSNNEIDKILQNCINLFVIRF